MMFGARVNGVLFLRVNDVSINLTEIMPFLLAISLAGIFHNWNWENAYRAWFGVGVMALPIILISTIGFLPATVICLVMCLTVMYVSSASLWQIIMLTAAGILYLMVALFSLFQADGAPLSFIEFMNSAQTGFRSHLMLCLKFTRIGCLHISFIHLAGWQGSLRFCCLSFLFTEYFIQQNE